MIGACTNLSSLNRARHRRAENRPAGVWNTQRRQRARIMEGQASQPRQRRQTARGEGPRRRFAGGKPAAVCPGRPPHRGHVAASIPPPLAGARSRAGPAPSTCLAGPPMHVRGARRPAGRTPPRARNEKWRGWLVLSLGPGSGGLLNVPAAANPRAAADEPPALLDLLVVFCHAGPAFHGGIKALRFAACEGLCTFGPLDRRA